MKMTGIKALSGESKSLPAHGYGPCYEVFYDRKEGRVWGNYQVSSNSWTVYDDPDVIACGWITTPAKMKEIAEMIQFAIMCRDSMTA